MRFMIAAACAACFGLAFGQRLQVPAQAAPLCKAEIIEAGTAISLPSGLLVRDADGQMSALLQNTPGGQAGNPSIVGAERSSRRSLPDRMTAPRTLSRRQVRTDTRRTGQIHLGGDAGDARNPLATSIAAAPSPLRVRVRLAAQLTSANSQIGDDWRGTVTQDVILDGKTIARAGDQVTGKITFARSQESSDTPGQLTLRLAVLNGHPVSSSAFRAKAVPPRDGAAPGAGAVVGAIAGGGKGTAIGATAGAAAGTTAGAVSQSRHEVVLPAESVLTFTVTEKPVLTNPTKR